MSEQDIYASSDYPSSDPLGETLRQQQEVQAAQNDIARELATIPDSEITGEMRQLLNEAQASPNSVVRQGSRVVDDVKKLAAELHEVEEKKSAEKQEKEAPSGFEVAEAVFAEEQLLALQEMEQGLESRSARSGALPLRLSDTGKTALAQMMKGVSGLGITGGANLQAAQLFTPEITHGVNNVAGQPREIAVRDVI